MAGVFRARARLGVELLRGLFEAACSPVVGSATKAAFNRGVAAGERGWHLLITGGHVGERCGVWSSWIASACGRGFVPAGASGGRVLGGVARDRGCGYELEIHQRGSRVVLRSKTPDDVMQEADGLRLNAGPDATRRLMHDAAIKVDLDLNRISLLRSLRAARRSARASTRLSVRPPARLRPTSKPSRRR